MNAPSTLVALASRRAVLATLALFLASGSHAGADLPRGFRPGAALHPQSGEVWIASSPSTSPRRTIFARLHPVTGAVTPAFTIRDHRFSGLAFTADGRLFALSGNCEPGAASSLFEIDLAAGNATRRAALYLGTGCDSGSYRAIAHLGQDGHLHYTYFKDDGDAPLRRSDRPSLVNVPVEGQTGGRQRAPLEDR